MTADYRQATSLQNGGRGSGLSPLPRAIPCDGRQRGEAFGEATPVTAGMNPAYRQGSSLSKRQLDLRIRRPVRPSPSSLFRNFWAGPYGPLERLRVAMNNVRRKAGGR